MRKAQITIFIIIGLVILIGAIVVWYVYQTQTQAPIKSAITVPKDVQPVYDYVSSCIDQIGKEGLSILGLQGGYINVPPIIERNPNSYVAADGVGVFKMPMWYYEGEDRTPSLDFMQRELEVHIKENLADCVDNFAVFSNQFAVEPLAEPIPVATFANSEVIIDLKWPLAITFPDRRTELDLFVTSYPVKMKQMVDTAQKVMAYENRETWFENLTIDLMVSNEDIPFSGMEIYCGTKKWHLTEVKREAQNVLYYNLPYVRLKNTQLPETIASERTYELLKDKAVEIRERLIAERTPDFPKNVPEDLFEVNRMTIDAGVVPSTLKASFAYNKDWPFFINAQPNRGGILSTAQVKGASKYLRFLCLNQWHFTYDVIYPIKMVLKDDDAFNGEGYTFQFAFPVIIEDNEESRVYFGLRKFVIPEIGTEFCETLGEQSIDIRAKGFTESSPVANELEGAQVRYTCVNRECILGDTYSDGSGAIRLNTFLPQGCGNPKLTVSKEGYLPESAYAGEEDRVELMLTKLRTMNYSIMLHPYYETVSSTNPLSAKDEEWLTSQVHSRFTNTMHATIAISARNKPYDQFILYPANFTDFTESSRNYALPPRQNNTNEVSLIYDDAQYDIDILLFKGETPIGGYHAENITISYDDVASANSVVFHAVEYRPLPDDSSKQAGMFVFLYERGNYTDGRPYWDALRPTFT